MKEVKNSAQGLSDSTVYEIETFIKILIYMRIYSAPSVSHYWNVDLNLPTFPFPQ